MFFLLQKFFSYILPASFQGYGYMFDQPPNPAIVNNQAYARAKALLIAHEGRRDTVYYDSKGFLTVGIGHKVVPGDNLVYGQKITQSQIDAFFNADISRAFAAAKNQAVELKKYTPDMIAALTEVNFQLGTGWTRNFANTWSELKRGNVSSAVNRLNQSDWKKQTPVRVASFINTLQSEFG